MQKLIILKKTFDFFQSTMIANKDENTFKKPKSKSKLNMKTLNYIFQNFGDENNELMVKFRRMLLIVAAKNSDLVAEERIKTGTPQSTIRYFVEAAVNPTKEKFSQVNDRHELGQDFLLGKKNNRCLENKELILVKKPASTAQEFK